MSIGRPRAASLAAVAIAATLVALAAPALAQETTLSGQTTEGVGVKLQIAEFGNATSFQIGRTKVDCNRGGELTTRRTSFANFDRSDPGAFSAKYGHTSNSEGLKFRTKTKIRGAAEPDGSGAWSGTFRNRTAVVEDGEKIDTCRLKTHWQAN